MVGEHWALQNDALAAMPAWLRPNEPSSDLLAYCHQLLGMNRAQMYVKVAGCRTPAHQENNDFCAVNVNFGPGDCTWWAVDTGSDAQVAQQIEVMCSEYGHNYFTGSWWPNEEELKRRGINVMRFVQRPGEAVFVGIGTLHWVRAEGTTVNVAWNMGPPTVRQFEAAVRRYGLNRARGIMSVVPLQALSWRLLDADIVKANSALLASVRDFCASGLREELRAAELCAKLNLSVRRADINAAYCVSCSGELFNHVFTIRNAHYCGRCVPQRRGGITVTLRRPLAEIEQLLA